MKKQLGKIKKVWILIVLFIIAILVWQISYRIYINYEYPRKYTDIVEKYATRYGVDEALIYSVIKCESGFSPNAVSAIGAKGLMQITEETFNWAKSKLKEKDTVSFATLDDVESNIKYGSFILNLQLIEFGDVNTALCAYHAGRSKVKSWLASNEYSNDGKTINNIPDTNRNTNLYVKRVNEALKIYRKMELAD